MNYDTVFMFGSDQISSVETECIGENEECNRGAIRQKKQQTPSSAHFLSVSAICPFLNEENTMDIFAFVICTQQYNIKLQSGVQLEFHSLFGSFKLKFNHFSLFLHVQSKIVCA